MLNPDAKLSAKVFADDIEKKATRDGFGTGVVESGKTDRNVVVLSADLKESTRAEEFEKAFPTRFIEMGVAEQNMATVAAGLAGAGKIPFITSYAAFSPGRNYEQIRTTIALNQMPVKVCGMHAGVSVGPDGATHQMLEDIGMVRMLPGMVVLNPGDSVEAHKAVVVAAANGAPTYLRFGRSGTPVFTTLETPFTVGKALTLWDSEAPRVALISTGALSYEALGAAKLLAEEGIESVVLHFATIKPLDEVALLGVARRAGRVITIEEHMAAGGFGSAVAEFLAEHQPVPLKILGVQDSFGQSGTPEELIRHYGLDAVHIASTARAFMGV